ncbi:MAG: sugar porter family MFS transporter [Planctomycetales bacterium]|nr:sugar porter family MFS transporter [Planctomycetales bacterium]
MQSAASATSHSPSVDLLRRTVIVTMLGGFLFGYDTAVINGAIQYLRLGFGLDATQEGLAGAGAILGCVPGALLAGWLSDWIGRRRALMICALLFAVSGLLSALPRTFPEFLAARIIGGLAIGGSSMICPVYIAELAPAQKRGQLGTMFQLGIVVGIFLTLLVNASIQRLGDEVWNAARGWRWMLGAEVLPAAALFLLLPTAPESPRWLLSTGRDSEAHAMLVALLGEAAASDEIAGIRDTLDRDEGSFRELFGIAVRRPMAIAIVLMAVSQLSGINAIMYYSTRIFASAGHGVADAFSASVVIGIVNLVFTLVALAFVDRAGRRPLLLIGLATQLVALSVVALMFGNGVSGWWLLVPILIFIASFAMALGPIPWILCSEIFPNRLRGKAMSLATMTIWATCYLVAQTFPMLNDSPRFGPVMTFGCYAAVSFLGLLFVATLVPETKGKTLEQIEATWRTV